MRRPFGWVFICLPLAAACASMSESECRTSELYAEQCSRFGVVPNEKEYMAGWGAGYGEWNRRVSRGRN